VGGTGWRQRLDTAEEGVGGGGGEDEVRFQCQIREYVAMRELLSCCACSDEGALSCCACSEEEAQQDKGTERKTELMPSARCLLSSPLSSRLSSRLSSLGISSDAELAASPGPPLI
jgi:hypothetical protein